MWVDSERASECAGKRSNAGRRAVGPEKRVLAGLTENVGGVQRRPREARSQAESERGTITGAASNTN